MSEQRAGNSTETSTHPQNLAFPIVGIGASAGGLEALQVLFANVDPTFPAAYVVVQHLSPDFKSKMDELLARKVALPINIVAEGMQLQPKQIYLMPPRREMVLNGGLLRLIEVDNKDHLSLPIDHFFKSLAQEAGKRAVGVILSGTGTDGSRGIQEIKRRGGLTITQSAATAKFTGMITASRNNGDIDLDLDPENIPKAIVNRVENHLVGGQDQKIERDDYPDEYDDATKQLLNCLNQAYGVDFSQYNPSMILRRVSRRKALMGTGDSTEFLSKLRNDSERLSELFHDLLIGVSSFFRDPHAMKALREKVVETLVEDAEENAEVRVWIEGCATGQEAYTLAIIFLEAIKDSNKHLTLKVFATDVHKDSLNIASKGVYSKEDLEPIDATLRELYFDQHDTAFRANELLRKHIVFAIHNALNSPPFTRMDLISCRNMLIYFAQPAKRKALSLFNFGLKRNGYLFLGSSESPSGQENEFETIDKKAKIYRKIEATRTSPTTTYVETLPVSSPLRALPSFGGTWDQRVSQNHLLRTYEHLLDECMPTSMLIESDYSIVHTFGGAEQFIKIQKGRTNVRVPDCLPKELRTPCAALLRKAKAHGKSPTMRNIKTKTAGHGEIDVDLTVTPIIEKRSGATRYLVKMGYESPSSENADLENEVDEISFPQTDHLRSLEEELISTQENLHSANEELEASNEELQATNEELVASNEELQSTNEELQSVNEELQSVNAEHQQKIIELGEVTSDLENLLDASQLGVFFLDENLRIKRFTPLVSQLFHITNADINRSLLDFNGRLDYPTLENDLQFACEKEETVERHLKDDEGIPYLVRIIPQFQQSVFKGAIGTIVNIRSLTEAQSQVLHLSSVVSSSADAIITLNLEGIVQTWNKGAENLFGYNCEEAVGKDLRELFGSTKKTVKEVTDYISCVRNGKPIAPFEATRRTKEGVEKSISVRVSPLYDAEGDLIGVSIIDRDITDLTRAKKDLRERDLESQLILESLTEGVIRIDSKGICKKANAPAARILDLHDETKLEGRALSDVIDELALKGDLDTEKLLASSQSNEARESHRTVRSILTTAEGQERIIEAWSRPTKDPTFGHVLTLFDVTERVQSEKERSWLSTVVHASFDPIISFSPGGSVTFINKGGLELLGIPPEVDVAPMKLSDFYQSGEWQLIRDEGLPSALREGHWSGNTKIRRKNGEPLPISQSIFSHVTSDGKPYAFSTIWRDISEQDAYQEALRASDLQSKRYAAALSSVIENIPDFLLVVDKDLKVEFASQNSRALLNTIHTEIDMPEEIRRLVQSVIETGKPFIASDYKGILEFNFGKQTRFLLPRIQPNFQNTSGSTPSGATVLLQDVTEFRLLDKIKSDLLSTVSHELKTPVTSVRMALLLLLDECQDLTKTQSLLVSTASEETERLLRTLNSLLELTRFEQGKQSLELTPTSPRDIIQESISSFKNAMKMQSLELDLAIEANLPSVDIDIRQIQHALGNLLGNAIKHSPQGGSIRIEGAKSPKTGFVRFSVQDQGSGVPEEFQERIFDRFFKAPLNSKPGSGIGLNIAKEFILAHQGTISVHNNGGSGGGANFYFDLPVSNQSSSEK